MPGTGVRVGDYGWAELGELVTSFGYGVLSALVPVVNAESYVVVSGLSSIGRAVPVPPELQALLDRPSQVRTIEPTLDAFRAALQSA